MLHINYMSETGNCQVPFGLKGIDNLIKLAVMETSNVTPSFLCFLPEFQCAPANILYINGITESTGIQHMSGKSVPLPLMKRKSPHETLDSTNRLPSSSVQAGPCLSNGFAQSKISLAGDLCPLGIVEKGTQHDLLDTPTETDTPNLENIESGNDQSIGNHFLTEESSGEIDILAFEITEFFNAFQDGQEHNLLKFTRKLDLLSPKSTSESEGDPWGAKFDTVSMDQLHLKSDKVLFPVDVDHIDGRISSSAGRSGKWNGLLEVDSFSATLSGPLTFSGPISFSGNSGHGPYSGSVSHRSDSSTASTHSFAFPILPYEWNSSPVKMAQPDKRFMQRPWKRRLRSLFCCAD